VAVQVPAARAAVRGSNAWALGFVFPLMGMLVLPLGIECRRMSLKRVLFAVLLLIALTATGAMLGCGDAGHPAPPTQQPTNYTITVTATSGSVSHSTTLTLTVQ
jgi:hypothetical protein